MLQLTINGTSWMTFRDAMRDREPFKTHGNLRGERCSGYIAPGYLPEAYRAETQERHDAIDYVVYSYGTPIAWHDTERGWVFPDVRYSVTTSKAQGRIAPGVAALMAEND